MLKFISADNVLLLYIHIMLSAEWWWWCWEEGVFVQNCSLEIQVKDLVNIQMDFKEICFGVGDFIYCCGDRVRWRALVGPVTNLLF